MIFYFKGDWLFIYLIHSSSYLFQMPLLLWGLLVPMSSSHKVKASSAPWTGHHSITGQVIVLFVKPGVTFTKSFKKICFTFHDQSMVKTPCDLKNRASRSSPRTPGSIPNANRCLTKSPIECRDRSPSYLTDTVLVTAFLFVCLFVLMIHE